LKADPDVTVSVSVRDLVEDTKPARGAPEAEAVIATIRHKK